MSVRSKFLSGFFLSFLLVPLVLFAGFKLAGVGLAQQSAGSLLWSSGEDYIEKRSTSDGALLLTIPLTGELRSFAVDGANSRVWAFAGNNLLSYDFDGALISATTPPGHNNDDDDNDDGDDDDDDDDGGIDDAAVAVNLASGGLWVALDDNIYCVSPNGLFGSPAGLGDDVESLSVNQSASVAWVATEEEVTAYSSACAPIVSIDLDDDVEAIHYDNASSLLWIALDDEVRAYSSAATVAFTLGVDDVEAIGSTGDAVWLAADEELVKVSNGGVVLLSVDLDDDIEAIAGDSDGSVWVALDEGLVHVGPNGAILATIDTDDEIERLIISSYSPPVPPTISITAPADGGFLNVSSPVIMLSYQDSGAGQVCI